MLFGTCQRLFEKFDPQRPLREEDRDLYVQRAESVVEELVRQLRFDGVHRFALVGAVGSGKSTELFRAFEQQRTVARYVTVLLDLYAQFKVDDLTPGQVLFLVALSVLHAAGLTEKNDKKLFDELRKAYLDIVEGAKPAELKVGKLLQGLATIVAGVALGPEGAMAANVAGAMAGAADLSVSLPGRGKPLRPNETSTRRLESALKEAVAAAREATGGKRFIVLVDGLDKVRAHERVFDLFCGGVLAAPGVHGLDLVYTAPPSVAFEVGLRGGGFQVLRLGVFNLFRKDGRLREPEVDAMRALLSLRVHAAGLDAGAVWPDGDVRHPSVDRIIEASGGITRDLVQIVRRAVVRASGDERDVTLSAADLDGAIEDFAKEQYLLRLDLGIEDDLRKAWIEKQRPDGNRIPSLLNDNFLIYYENGQPWCRPHPLVMPRLRERFGEEIDAGGAGAAH